MTEKYSFDGIALRKGGFGSVFVARDLASNMELALKKVVVDSEDESSTFHELEMLKYISQYHHPCVMNLKHHFVERSAENVFLYLVMELFPSDVIDLCHLYMTLDQHIPISDVKMYSHQLFHALAHLHQHNICHRYKITTIIYYFKTTSVSRDIKPGNILIDNVKCELKVCDFGCSINIHDSRSRKIHQPRNLGYLAPELFINPIARNTCFSNDVWSAGVVVAGLLKGGTVFSGDCEQEIYHMIEQVILLVHFLKKVIISGTQALRQIRWRRKAWCGALGETIYRTISSTCLASYSHILLSNVLKQSR